MNMQSLFSGAAGALLLVAAMIVTGHVPSLLFLSGVAVLLVFASLLVRKH